MKNFINHIKTIISHRKFVRHLCFKMGLFWQGLTHDLSKFSPTEMSIAKYYTGKNSPHQECRNRLGYSPCWMHHYHINKHHYQYWYDTSETDEFIPIKMPYKYVLEMFCDRVSACKAYNKDKYTNQDAWNYFVKNTKGHGVMHSDTEYLLAKLLWMLHECKSEKEFFNHFKQIKTYLQVTYEAGTLEEIDILTERNCEA